MTDACMPSLYTIKTYLIFLSFKTTFLTLEIDEMSAKEIAMNFFGYCTDDDVCATLKEKNWHVILNTENSKVEVLVDTSSGRILSCVLLGVNMRRSN